MGYTHRELFLLLIPLIISPLLRNYCRYKKNLPLEKNIYGRIIKNLKLKQGDIALSPYFYYIK